MTSIDTTTLTTLRTGLLVSTTKLNGPQVRQCAAQIREEILRLSSSIPPLQVLGPYADPLVNDICELEKIENETVLLLSIDLINRIAGSVFNLVRDIQNGSAPAVADPHLLSSTPPKDTLLDPEALKKSFAAALAAVKAHFEKEFKLAAEIKDETERKKKIGELITKAEETMKDLQGQMEALEKTPTLPPIPKTPLQQKHAAFVKAFNDLVQIIFDTKDSKIKSALINNLKIFIARESMKLTVLRLFDELDAIKAFYERDKSMTLKLVDRLVAFLNSIEMFIQGADSSVADAHKLLKKQLPRIKIAIENGREFPFDQILSASVGKAFKTLHDWYNSVAETIEGAMAAEQEADVKAAADCSSQIRKMKEALADYIKFCLDELKSQKPGCEQPAKVLEFLLIQVEINLDKWKSLLAKSSPPKENEEKDILKALEIRELKDSKPVVKQNGTALVDSGKRPVAPAAVQSKFKEQIHSLSTAQSSMEFSGIIQEILRDLDALPANLVAKSSRLGILLSDFTYQEMTNPNAPDQSVLMKIREIADLAAELDEPHKVEIDQKAAQPEAVPPPLIEVPAGDPPPGATLTSLFQELEDVMRTKGSLRKLVAQKISFILKLTESFSEKKPESVQRLRDILNPVLAKVRDPRETKDFFPSDDKTTAKVIIGVLDNMDKK